MASAADFEVGQEVFVLPGGYSRKAERPRPIRARIREIARVWMVIEAADRPKGRVYGYEWRMRADTQDEGDRNYPRRNARFFTLEQWEKRERETEASALLQEQGIDLRLDSPWREHEVELADLLREALSKRDVK